MGRIAWLRPAGGGSSSSFAATFPVNVIGRKTMGSPVPQGQLPAGQGVQVGAFATQTDVQSRWLDGSARFIAVSFDATSTGSKSVLPIANPGGSYTPTWPSAAVTFTIDGTAYVAALPSFDGTHTVCDGAVARRAWVIVEPATGGGSAHPLLQVLFEVTSYVAGGHRLSIGWQNVKNTSAIDKVTYDLDISVAGSSVFSKEAHTHYTGQRYHKSFWTGATEAEVLHDFQPWIDAHCIPKIVDADPKTYDLDPESNAAYALGGGVTYILYFGEAEAAMGDSENADRQELNAWTDWEARLFRLNTEAYRQVVLANSEQSGCWSTHLCKTSDGKSIFLPVTDPDVSTHQGSAGAASGFAWPSDAGSQWKGAFWSDNVPSGICNYDNEHVSELNFTAYLLTCDTWHLDQLRFRASWASLLSYGGSNEPDPYIWPGWIIGRNGTAGILMDGGISREFGRPFKLVSRCAWALPDGHADQANMQTLTQSNLDRVGEYIDYLDSRGWNGQGWTDWVGMWPSDGWRSKRGNTVSSTASGATTTLTVVGDDSGVGVSINDHAMQTGDSVDLSGFVTPGATALNGHHEITRLSATSFSVAVTTAASTTGEGAWVTTTGHKVPTWRVGTAAYAVHWALHSGLFTTSTSMWQFVERHARTMVALQDNPAFDTAPGVSYNYYPTPHYVVADDLVFFQSWADYQTANEPNTATGRLYASQWEYANFPLTFTTHHRGSADGNAPFWNPANPNAYYTPYANIVLAAGAVRGVPGAAAALARNVAASDVLAELKRRPGYYHGVP
jgi:hypothetical protein